MADNLVPWNCAVLFSGSLERKSILMGGVPGGVQVNMNEDVTLVITAGKPRCLGTRVGTLRREGESETQVTEEITGPGVDLNHRDARAAIGQTRDGRLLVALTRFDGAGGVLDFVPFGLTTPEMAAIMGALGARDAVLLDGGISSQLLIRDGATTRSWKGVRRVPLALVAVAR